MLTELALAAGLLVSTSPAVQENKDELEDRVEFTEGSVTTTAGSLDYQAKTGTLVLRRENGEARASVFFVYYTKTEAGDPGSRPLTVCFNGGPGSSSVWLHLGAFGPQRVDMGPEGFSADPPFQLVENHESLLDLSDLLFIDPVMTGFSRPAEGEDKAQFHGLTEDVESVGSFLRLFLTREERWASPLFLAGESYGTTRAAALTEHLQSRYGIYPVGIVLISTILSFQTAETHSGNDLPYPLLLPTLTATAWYHHRLEPSLSGDLEATLAEVEEFALGDYASALMLGDGLAPEKRSAIADRLARFLGLEREFVEENNLRVDLDRFNKELLRDQRRTVGRLDTRFVGIDRDLGADGFSYDPSYAAIRGAFSMTMNDYVGRVLDFQSDLPYEVLTGRVFPWSFASWENRYVDVGPNLVRAMNQNRGLRVFVASGYYDEATPYFATHYTFAHLGLDPELQDHVSMGHYESGHMVYLREASRRRLKKDLVGFYAQALAK